MILALFGPIPFCTIHRSSSQVVAFKKQPPIQTWYSKLTSSLNTITQHQTQAAFHQIEFSCNSIVEIPLNGIIAENTYLITKTEQKNRFNIEIVSLSMGAPYISVCTLALLTFTRPIFLQLLYQKAYCD